MPNDSLINNFESINGNKSCDSYIHPPTNKLVPELEVPFKKYVIKQSVKPRKKEGLNSLYKASAIFWLLLCHRHPSLRLQKTHYFIREAMRWFEYKLFDLSKDPECLDYPSLIDHGYMKEKHWIYSAYIGTLTSLPLLYKTCNKWEILWAILAKTSFGASMKLLDNLNDEIHNASQAVESLWNWLSAHTKGEYINRNKAHDQFVTKAENSAFKMETWVFDAVSSGQVYESDIYQNYINDANKWVKGQSDSVKHKTDHKGRFPSIRGYISYISEKSIGDIWIDIDLCFLGTKLKTIEDQLKAIKLLKIGNSLIFKSLLFYDDIQDIYEDLRTNSINSAIILALEKGIISYEDLDKNPKELVKRLDESGIFMYIIKLADMVFLTGIEMLDKINDCLEGILDKQGLIQSYRLLRMFLFRKFLNMNRDFKTLKLFFSSLGDFERIKKGIPEEIIALQRYFIQ